MSHTCYTCRRILSGRLRTILRFHELSRRGLHVSHIRSALDQPLRESSEATRSIYNDTLPPTQTQSRAASQFFLTYQPRISWVAEEWRKQAHSSTNTSSTLSFMTPEIAFLGRSNTGKSSLLNALLHTPDLCRVGAKPGKTTTMHAWTLSTATQVDSNKRRGRVGRDTTSKTGTKTKTGAIVHEAHPDDRLTVLDMPGYGHGSREEWGSAIVKYLQRRRQLRRTMVLVNPKHGVKEGDEQIIQMLQSNNIPYQIIACKCDTIPSAELSKRLATLREDIMRIEGHGNDTDSYQARITGMRIDDILAIGGVGDGKMNKTKNSHGMYGMDDVRWTILKAVGLDRLAMQEYNNQAGKKSDGVLSRSDLAPAYNLERRGDDTTRVDRTTTTAVQ